MICRRRTAGAIALTALLATAGPMATHSSVVFNVTPSEPEGLYLTAAAAPNDLRTGQLVAACPPQNTITVIARSRGYLAPGRCPGDLITLLKQVEATAGDVVNVEPRGITVNGHLLNNTAPLEHDNQGRPLAHFPFGTYHVAVGQVWLASTYAADSFDARYFGPIEASSIEAVVIPIWTH